MAAVAVACTSSAPASPRELATAAGAASILSAVVVDKARKDAIATADYAAFIGVPEFIVGYGMDDSGNDRALPYIAKAD